MIRILAWLALVPIILLGFCKQTPAPSNRSTAPFDAAFVRIPPLDVAALPLATRVTSPMGNESGALTYNAQPFRLNRHLGDDLNGIGGWNSDLGDAVYATNTGQVLYAGWPSDGWGNMLIVAHRVRQAASPTGWVVHQSVYAHLDSSEAKPGQAVADGVKIGTVGTAGGRYLAHLHHEVRVSLSIYPGPGYSEYPLDRISPAGLQPRALKDKETAGLSPEAVARSSSSR